MNDLTTKKCVACEGGVPPLSPDEVDAYQKKFEAPWEVLSYMKLRKSFTFPDFKTALAFTNKVGEIAEAEGHHPDIQLSWGKVIIELTTHAIKGLSENDFILAAKIDTLKN